MCVDEAIFAAFLDHIMQIVSMIVHQKIVVEIQKLITNGCIYTNAIIIKLVDKIFVTIKNFIFFFD